MTPERRRLAEYLLNRLPAAEAAVINEQLFEDETLFAEMDEVERDLLDAYAQGRLSKAEAVAVESAAQTSESRREKLRFAIALASRMKTAAPPRNYWLAAAAALFLMLTGAAVWIVRLSSANEQLEAAMKVRQAERDNAPAVAFLLSPLQRGSAVEQLDVNRQASLIRLNFAIETKAGAVADIRIKTQAGTLLADFRNAAAQDAGYYSVWVAAGSLPPGSYTAELVERDGRQVDYAFRIRPAVMFR